MEKEILQRYFERACSPTEIQAVEDWLLDPSNKITFESFLVEEWREHVEAQEFSNLIRIRKSRSTPLWKVASVAALLILTFGIYQIVLVNSEQSGIAKKEMVYVPQQSPVNPLPLSRPPHLSDTVRNVELKTVQHARKKKLHQPKALIVQVDSTNQETQQPTVPARTLTKAKINEVAIARLIQKIDSNRLVFDVNVSDIDFRQLAYIFRTEYGIVLELCANADTDKTYTAKFKKISIHDLLDDMSEKMAFTYTFQDNKVTICFN